MRIPMNRRLLVRPADAFLPLALLLAALFGHGMTAVYLFACLWGARILALSTAGSLRMAFALQPSMRDVQGSVKCALLAQPSGAALLALLLRCLSAEWLRPEGLAFLGAGLLLNLEHAFYEYLYSAGDGGSALLARLITAALTFAGLVLSETIPAALTIAAAASMLAVCAVALVVGGALKGKLNAQPLRSAPACILQDLLYPAAFAGLMLALPRFLPAFHRPFDGLSLAPWDASFFAGLAVYSLCRSTFRRSKSEARQMNIALPIVSAVGVLIALPALLRPKLSTALPTLNGYAFADLPVFGAALLLACLCGFALFGNAGKGE